MSGWITTRSLTKFYPLKPVPRDLHIMDIAHSLSNICRYNGHCPRFYSVAQHSILVAQFAPDHLKLDALLHDASEAFLCDLPAPLKVLPEFKEYRIAEREMQKAIAARYGVQTDNPEVNEIDRRALATEAEQFGMITPEWPCFTAERLPVEITPMSPVDARAAFIAMYLTAQALR